MARLLLIISLAVLSGGLQVWAGSFRVTPVLVEVSTRRPHGSVSVVNLGETAETVQLQVLRWSSKDDGSDQYSDTSDILVNPPIFKIAAGTTQIVRLGLRYPKPSPAEIAYRLILQQLPATGKTGGNVLGTVLRISLPVFVAPLNKGTPDLRWQFQYREPGKVTVRVENRGNVHERIEKLMFFLGDATGPLEVKNRLTYVLPGGHREFTLSNPALEPKSRLVVKTTTTRGKIETIVPPSQN